MSLSLYNERVDIDSALVRLLLSSVRAVKKRRKMIFVAFGAARSVLHLQIEGAKHYVKYYIIIFSISSSGKRT